MKRPFYARIYKDYSAVDNPEYVINVKNIGEIFCLQYIMFKPTAALTAPFWVYVGVGGVDYAIYNADSLGTSTIVVPINPIWLPDNTYIRLVCSQAGYTGTWVGSVFGYTSPLQEGMV